MNNTNYKNTMSNEKFLKLLEESLYIYFSSIQGDKLPPPTTLSACTDCYLTINYLNKAFKTLDLLDNLFEEKYKTITNKLKPKEEEIQYLINILQSKTNVINQKDNMFSRAEDLSKTSVDSTTRACEILQQDLQENKIRENDESLKNLINNLDDFQE